MELVQLDLRHGTDGAVGIVTLNDPSHRNMLSARLVAELIEAVDTVEGDLDVGAIVVTGAPPAFCAGADLGNLGSERARASGAGSGREAGTARSRPSRRSTVPPSGQA